jgi:hypothetical protein
MKTKTLFASLAVASLAIAQPLSAATRSADSLPQRGAQSTAVADRAGSLAGESEELRGNPVIPIALIALIVAAIILAAGGGKSKG